MSNKHDELSTIELARGNSVSGDRSAGAPISSLTSPVAAAAAGHDDDHHEAIAPTKMPEWLQNAVEYFFKVKKRKTTIELEVYTGIVQFISCLYVLPVVPFQMKRAGYDETGSVIATAITCCVGCIFGAFLTDMPLIVAPPTSVSIFFAVSMQQSGMNYLDGNAAMLISGAALAFIGIVPPLGRFFTKLIPSSMQAAISTGIGLITALAGATEINLVVRGKYTILDMGEITPEIVIAIAALIIVAVLLHYHVKGAFCIGLFIGTLLYWIVEEDWPEAFAAKPQAIMNTGLVDNKHFVLLIFNMFFLFILTLNGLARSLTDLAQLTKADGRIPRGKFLFMVTGLTTMLSGYFSGPPILLSPESAAGIKAGAKTGLSTLICGILFGISTFFAPFLAAIPSAGTAPLLIMVGVMMFGNAKRINWQDYKEAVPAYCVLFFIPFTYSILRGVAFGYIIYIMINLYTGDLIADAEKFFAEYRQPWFARKAPGAKPLAGQELEHDELSPEELDHQHEEEIASEQKKTFFGRTILNIQKVLDAQEMSADTGAADAVAL